MLAAIGVTWFITYTISAILVVWCHHTFSDKAEASRALSTLSPCWVWRHPRQFPRLRHLPAPAGAQLVPLPVSAWRPRLWGGIMPYSPWLHLAMVAVGMAGGAFMSPLYAFVQDRARPRNGPAFSPP